MIPGAPDPEVQARATRLLGWTPTEWFPVAGGYTPAARYRVTDGRRSAFVKHATTPLTAGMVNREIDAYRRIDAPFLPRLYGAEAHPHTPLLAIEDLSDATWPPPWTPAVLDPVLDTIRHMHGLTADLPPRGLGDMTDSGWTVVAEDPSAFLSLGLVTSQWLDHALPLLLAAEASCDTSGTALTHFDLRSDNICMTTNGVKIVDWAEAGVSSPEVDLGFFLPSLAYEGGPLPETILPDAPATAAAVAGFFAARAGLPDIPDAPFVRRVQRQQLSTALPWAIRALNLPQGR